MNRQYIYLIVAIIAFVSISFKTVSTNQTDTYTNHYDSKLNAYKSMQQQLLKRIQSSDIHSTEDLENIKTQINITRENLKGMDFWFRYLEPLAQKRINGPLPVEWETEVFEKFEKPYKREGAGLTLAALYIEEEEIEKDTLLKLIQASVDAVQTYSADSITSELKTYHHFFLCNRLFLLNLATIYTTGFECPDTSRVIPELKSMLDDVNVIYTTYNESFSDTKLSDAYMDRYRKALAFVKSQPEQYSAFDHFTFIQQYVNPLFKENQSMIRGYRVVSRSLIDYSLNKSSTSIFDKNLYNGQNPKGVFIRVNDEAALIEIDRIGKLLFYDPILSGNNLRSCASCHIPTQHFTDTTRSSSLQFNRKDLVPRNAPSLINVKYNHLVMMDGAHISLQHQTKGVIGNETEMGSNEEEVLKKVLSCDEYKNAFKKLLKYTPQEPEIGYEHIVSAITMYYSKFSNAYSPFDEAMNTNASVNASVKEGYNLFMSKAQCATCHFAPQFNGVKPPYVNSEFEVLGVPEDNLFNALSDDKGRYGINPAYETMNGFRTGTVRNASFTHPYMHNGVFHTLEEVVEFYNGGGGAGRGLDVPNQTLSSDSLHLTNAEIRDIIVFIESLNEAVPFEAPPASLPISKSAVLNQRIVGGVY
ncbi:MAG: cytochrome C peroxidase [Cytophagales bacterium]|nr:cytochrome C peroxidase [Cytophaga sp.]